MRSRLKLVCISLYGMSLKAYTSERSVRVKYTIWHITIILCPCVKLSKNKFCLESWYNIFGYSILRKIKKVSYAKIRFYNPLGAYLSWFEWTIRHPGI